MQNTDMVRRRCLDRLLDLADDPRMKVIIGPVYSGKTVLLRQIQGGLIMKGVSDNLIAKVSFDKGMGLVDSPETFLHVLEQSCAFESGFLLIDSVHLAPDFAYTMNLFRLRHPKVSVYMTLSLNTMQPSVDALNFIPKEDVVVTRLYPFTFREFMSRSPSDPDSAMLEFISSGGFPFVHQGISFEDRSMVFEGYVHILMTRLILRESKCSPLGISQLLNYIMANLTSPLTQKDLVTNSGIADNRTLEKYLQRYIDSGMLFSLKGYQLDRAMKESTKFTFCAVDTLNGGFVDMESFPTLPVSVILANMTFIELKVRGYDPCVLMSKGESIAFGVERDGRMQMIRVAAHASQDSSLSQFALFRSSSLPKLYLTLDKSFPDDPRMNHRNLPEFLLADDF